jgi:hypothetical protein
MVCEAKAQSERAKRPETRERIKKWKKEWHHKNPDKIKRTCLRVKMRRMNVPEQDIPSTVERLMSTTHCEICGGAVEQVGTLHVDHCHASNRFRGMLCGGCNNGLGHFKDDPARLEKAIEYLKRFRG